MMSYQISHSPDRILYYKWESESMAVPKHIQGTIPVRNHLRWLIFISIISLGVGACTRERPAPEPTATSALPAAPAGGSGGGEPAVTVETATPEEAAVEETLTPPEAGPVQTFEHRVEAGETLLSVAEQFDTDVETLRKLNFLINDNIIAGQILQIPYIEGMTAEGAPTPTSAPYRYAVQVGDTLGSISLKFNVSTVAIIEANGLLDPDNLVVGQEILIPGYQPAAQEGGSDSPATTGEEAGSEGQVVHVVQQGESLSEIAQSYNVDANALAQANGIINPNLLRAGQKLVIPGITLQEAARLRGTIHVVQAGESLLSIATRYGVTVEELMTTNAIANPNQILVGQELIIPQ
jgi:LysM repeat protein